MGAHPATAPRLLITASTLAALGVAVYGVATALLASLSPPSGGEGAEAFQATLSRLAQATAVGLGLVLAGLGIFPLAFQAGPPGRPRAAFALGAVAAALLVTVSRWLAGSAPPFSSAWSAWATVEAAAWLAFAVLLSVGAAAAWRGAHNAEMV